MVCCYELWKHLFSDTNLILYILTTKNWNGESCNNHQLEMEPQFSWPMQNIISFPTVVFFVNISMKDSNSSSASSSTSTFERINFRHYIKKCFCSPSKSIFGIFSWRLKCRNCHVLNLNILRFSVSFTYWKATSSNIFLLVNLFAMFIIVLIS